MDGKPVESPARPVYFMIFQSRMWLVSDTLKAIINAWTKFDLIKIAVPENMKEEINKFAW